jgi:hypothetical protein
MTRTATAPQTFLHWHDDVPYLVSWTPGTNFGTLEARVADDDFAPAAASSWSVGIRLDVAATALEQIAAINVQMHHDAAAAKRRLRPWHGRPKPPRFHGFGGSGVVTPLSRGIAKIHPLDSAASWPSALIRRQRSDQPSSRKVMAMVSPRGLPSTGVRTTSLRTH